MKHEIKLICALALTCALSGLAHADDAIKAANRQVNLNYERQKIEYHEYDNEGVTNGGWLDSENGSQNGVSISYTHQFDADGVKDWYVSTSFAYAKGKTDYDGYLQSYVDGSLTPWQSKSDVKTTDFDLKFGKGFRFASDRVQLTPVGDYLYHTWKRDLAPGTPYGYREDYKHSALSLGLLGQFAITNRFVASAYGSIGRTLSPELKVEHAATLNLKSRTIYSLSFDLNYRITDSFDVHGGVQQTRYKYGQSDVEYGGIYEPESKTTLTNYYVGAGYAF